MKKCSKIFALILAMVMVVGVFASCGSEKKAGSGNKYSYWVEMHPSAAASRQNYSELLMYQEIAKATGIEVSFIHPAAGSTGTEAFQILLASGDYPDMIEYVWTYYAGGPDKAIEDGVIIKLNDYLKEYAPNYYDYMEGEKGKANDYLYKAQSITTSGNYFGFANLAIGNIRGFSGVYVRKDLLDKWGLDVPVTIDDWDVFFATAKANGIKTPFTGNDRMLGAYGYNIFNGAWHLGNEFYIDDGEIKFGPFEKEYKTYLAKIVEWSQKGYFDKDYVTNDNIVVEGNIANGISVAAQGWIGGGLGKIIPAMAERNPDFKLVACPFPVLKEGDTPWFQEVGAEAADPSIAITVQCGKDDPERYKEAVKWCDYIYSDEGAILSNFGIEGDTYTVEKGEDGEEHYIYTDKIQDHEKIGLHSVEDALYSFFRPANCPGVHQYLDYLNGYYPYQEQKDALATWNEYVDEAKTHKLPPLFYTADEATRKANIEVKGKDNLVATVSNIILGKEPLSNLDAAIETAKKAGYDELIKIQQDAYDRYLKVIDASK